MSMEIPAQAGDRVIRIGGCPNERQAQFFASRATFTAYGGARGGGKSWALRRKLVGLCLCYPGIHCLLLRRTLSELKSNHVYPMLREYGAILRWQAGEMAFIFPNGSRIDAGYCDSDRDLLRYQGQEYDVIAIDEATQFPEMHFLMLSACLRGVRDFPRRMYLTCNPGGVGHAWVKRLFIDREFRAGERAEDYCFIPARVWDNTVLLRADPTYVRKLEGLPERLRAAWLDGRWDVFEGQFFSEFDEARHVGELDLSAVGERVMFGAMDYGFDRLVLLCMSAGEAGDLFVHEELCASGLTLGEAAGRCVGLCDKWRLTYIVASPDLWNRRQDSGLSGVNVMMGAASLPPMRAADDRRIFGWRMVREALHGNGGEPLLRISRKCPELISCMRALQCNPNLPEDAASEPHAVTHAPEALRYGVVSRAGLKPSARVAGGFRFRRSSASIWE